MKNSLKKIRQIIHRLASLLRERHGYISVSDNGFWFPRHPPRKSIVTTAALFNQMDGKTIIEIGTGLHGAMSGDSMKIWTAKTKAQRIIAIDLDQKRLDDLAELSRQHSNVERVLADGIRYLEEFPGTIDLLYLDFWAPDPKGELAGTGRAEAYRDAFLAAQEKMNSHSMILIDDTDHIHPWKHTFILPLAQENGYKVVHTGRQTLLKR